MNIYMKCTIVAKYCFLNTFFQYSDLTYDSMEDPNQQLKLLDEIRVIFISNTFTWDELKLKLFIRTLIAKAKSWLLSHPAGTF